MSRCGLSVSRNEDTWLWVDTRRWNFITFRIETSRFDTQANLSAQYQHPELFPLCYFSAEACAGHRFCGRGDEMQSHRQDHGIEKPYQCQHCPKRFSLKHQLDTHHRVHTGEKPFECRLCGQRSRDYSAMIKHLRTHGGAAPYQCTVCLEFCSSLVAMQRHVKSHAVQDFPPDWNINNTYLYTSHI